MSKRLFFVLLLLVVVVAAACTPAATPTPTAAPTESPTDEPTAVAQAATEVPPTDEPTAVPATDEPTEVPATEVPASTDASENAVVIAPGNSLVLGLASGLSGDGIAPLGIDIRRGAELALEDRPTVTVGGTEFPVTLDAQDDLCSPEGGQAVANRFAADGSVLGVVGPMCSSACLAAAPIFDAAGYTTISPSCTNPTLTTSDYGSFNRAVVSDAAQGVVAAYFIYNELGARRIATIHDGSAYGEGLVSVVTSTFEQLGGEVVASDAISVGDTDFRGLLEDFASEDPDLIYFGGFPAEAARIADQRADAGLEDVAMMGADGIKGQEFADLAGAAGVGVYATTSIPTSGEALAAFLTRYVETYGEEPPAPYHANAYDGANILLDAVEAVGTVDADGNLVVDRAALSAYVRSLTGFEGLVGLLANDGNGELVTSGQFSVSQVADGAFQDLFLGSIVDGEVVLDAAPAPAAEMTPEAEMTEAAAVVEPEATEVAEAAATMEAEVTEVAAEVEATAEAVAPTAVAMASDNQFVIAPGDSLVLGLASGLSGDGIAPLGIDIRRGAELALEDRSTVTVGGVEFPVVLDAQDDLCSPEGGQAVANRFAADGSVLGVVGPMCSSACLAAAPIFDAAGYTTISPSCTNPRLTTSDYGSFNRAVVSDAAQGVVAAYFIYNELGARRIATIHDGSAYGEGLVSVVTSTFEQLGGEVVASDAISVGDTDFRGLLEDFASEDPDLIYFGGFPAEAARIADQRADAGLEDVAMMGADGIKGQEFADLAGAAGVGVYATTSIPTSGEALAAFLTRYVETYGEEPPAPYHANAYDGANILLDAVEAVGTVDADGNLVVDRAALSAYVRSLTGFEGLVGLLANDGNGELVTSGQFSVSQVADGAFQDLFLGSIVDGEVVLDAASAPAAEMTPEATAAS